MKPFVTFLLTRAQITNLKLILKQACKNAQMVNYKYSITISNVESLNVIIIGRTLLCPPNLIRIRLQAEKCGSICLSKCVPECISVLSVIFLVVIWGHATKSSVTCKFRSYIVSLSKRLSP